MQSLFNKLDPAFRRVAFTGFPSTMDEVSRIDFLTSFSSEKIPGFKTCSVGNFYRGPASARVVSPAGYLEFKDAEGAKSFFGFLAPGLVGSSGCRYFGSWLCSKAPGPWLLSRPAAALTLPFPVLIPALPGLCPGPCPLLYKRIIWPGALH